MERDVPRMRLAVGGDHLHLTACRDRRGFTCQSALADTRWPDNSDDAAGASDRLVEDRGDRVSFPIAADERGFGVMRRSAFTDSEQLLGGYGFVGAFDVDEFGVG